MLNVGILLFNEVEVLDFAGPFEVFSVTSELNDYKLFKVFTITQDGKGIKTVNGLNVMPDFSFENHPPVDILVIPGGVGTKAEMNREQVLSWVGKQHQSTRITLSVCSGARILGRLGLLDHVRSTTHHEVLEHLQQIAPATILEPDRRFTDNGKIMTSGGISAGIDLSLHVVANLYGQDISDKTAIYMEYGDWRNLNNKGEGNT